MSQGHCTNCGRESDETHSSCCNDRVCVGEAPGYIFTIGTFDDDDRHVPSGTVQGCCSAAVEKTLPEGVYVLHRD
jgi:hypothetical protein